MNFHSMKINSMTKICHTMKIHSMKIHSMTKICHTMKIHSMKIHSMTKISCQNKIWYGSGSTTKRHPKCMQKKRALKRGTGSKAFLVDQFLKKSFHTMTFHTMKTKCHSMFFHTTK